MKDGRFSFYLDIYHLGKRKYEYLNIYLEKSDAEKKGKLELLNNIRAKREIELANNQHGFIPDFKRRASLIKFIERDVEARNGDRNYQAMLKHLKAYSKKDITFQEIDENWIEGYKKHLLSKVKINTAATYYAKFKVCYKQAKLNKLITTDITENVKNISLEDVKREYLIEQEIKTLSNTECQIPEVKRAFLFSCFTGLRFSDLKTLKWGNIVNNSIKLRQLKTNDLVDIPLSKTAIELLNNKQSNIYHLPNNLIFDIPQEPWANEILKRWFKKAKINKNAHFHLGRHTFATLNITSGTDLYTVQKLLGHKSIKNTEIYANLVDEKKRKAVDNLPEIEVNL